MGLKGAGPYFQRSMSNTVLAGPVNQICELYIHDVLIHGRDIESFLENVRKVNVAAKDVHQAVPDALSRPCDNHMPVKQDTRETIKRPLNLSALQVKQEIPHQDNNGSLNSVLHLPTFRSLRQPRGGSYGPRSSFS